MIRLSSPIGGVSFPTLHLELLVEFVDIVDLGSNGPEGEVDSLGEIEVFGSRERRPPVSSPRIENESRISLPIMKDRIAVRQCSLDDTQQFSVNERRI